MARDSLSLIFTTLDYRSFSNSCHVLRLTFFFPRGCGHAWFIHFLFDASQCRLIGFLPGAVFVIMHTCTMAQVQRDYRSIWNSGWQFQNCFPTVRLKGPLW